MQAISLGSVMDYHSCFTHSTIVFTDSDHIMYTGTSDYPSRYDQAITATLVVAYADD